jgi:hypothetical protein
MDLVTGDAPQPGETPRTEGNPWSFDPDAAWWRGDADRDRDEALAEAAARPRHPRRRPARGSAPATPSPGPGEPAFAEEALDAHAAGAHDAAEALEDTPATDAPTEVEDAPATQAGAEPAATGEQAEVAETVTEELTEPEPAAVERDHDQVTRERYNLPEHEEEPGRPDLAHRPEDVPEIMVLPEPDRPTVALPGQSSRPARPGGSRLSPAELNVKRSRVEHSPFWLNDDERAAAGNAWPAPAIRRGPVDAPAPAGDGRGKPPRRRPRTPRNAASGLFGLLALALIASFFSWVSAEPFWLAVGHGQRGVATVARCTGTGVTQRCAGSFVAADRSFSAPTVTLLGVGRAGRTPGTTAPARMVSAHSKQAYVGTTGPLVQLRWVLGFVLVLLCGLGIAGLTGTRQLETVQARRGALLMSVAGPLLLLTGFLFAAF